MSTDSNVIEIRPGAARPVDADGEEIPIVDAHLLPEPQSPERRPIVPEQYTREHIRSTFETWRELTWYRIRYHGVRVLPRYLPLSIAWSVVGCFKFVRTTHRWWMFSEVNPLKQSAVLRDDGKEFEVQSKHQEDVSKRRGYELLAIVLGGFIVAGAMAWYLAPWVPLALGFLIGYPSLAHYGHPKDKPIITRAVVPIRLEKLTFTQITDALLSLGIDRIKQALAKDPNAIRPIGEIHQVGPGWRADFLLPPGVTATEIIDKRDKFASGLGRPLGAVWPEGNHEISPGAVNLWVGYEDMARAKQAAWPLLRSGQVNLFKPIPFGTDQRGRQVRVELMYADMLIGAIKGAGKSFALRQVLLAAALDPRVEIWAYEFKGVGDLEALGHVATRYGCGAGDDMLEEALNALRALNEERARRAQKLNQIPRDLRPEYKITEHLASRQNGGLHPLIIAIDECQQLFQHRRYGTEAGELAEQLIRLGRAVGIIPLLATQRPDKDSVPTGVSANAGTRFCLRVMGQTENDMILGTSMYKHGIQATMFTSRDLGIGYLVGQGDPKIVRTYYVDGSAADKVALRARAMREKAGTLNGYALEGENEHQVRSRSLLDDIAAVIEPGEDRVWSVTLLERLVEIRPGVYDKWTQKTLGAALRNNYEIETKPISVRDGAEVTTNYGIIVEDLREFLAAREIGG